ncbi:MAG: hypothetical protein SVU32_04400 [Candidatus Nanohaloarchaea archaeon]|nr:hypothetical protein [Candidatus Nanohaloarchaea archaeon]
MDDLFDSVEEHGRFPSYEFEEVAGDRLDDIAAELQSRVEEGELYDFSLSYDVVIDTRVVGGLGHTRGRVSRSERETVRLHAITTEEENAAYPRSAEVEAFEDRSQDDLYDDIQNSIEEDDILALDIASYSSDRERSFVALVLTDGG